MDFGDTTVPVVLVELAFMIDRSAGYSNLLALAPIIMYPGVVLATAMLSDSGNNMVMVTVLFLLALIYPAILFRIRRFSYSLYSKNKVVAIVLPLIPAGLFISLLVFMIYNYVSATAHLRAWPH